MPSPNLNSEDYYQILGVDRTANDAQLKKAYRKLAVKVCHYVIPIELHATSSNSIKSVEKLT
jgi:preprotein translocase subunit Sec63